MNDDLRALVPTSGRALDIACGRGAQSLWLAVRGLDVVAIDVSDVAIELTEAAAAATGVSQRVDARQQDLSDGLPTDLGEFDIIVCQRFRNRRVLESLPPRLLPGGMALVSVLSAVGLERTPGKFHAPAGELVDQFTRDDVEIIWHTESSGLASIAIRRK